MTPEISEFSYGFALTNELVALSPLKAAPIFPSLIEEGRPGGGYDVKLQLPGIALYVQFKRGYCMKLASAKEIRTHKTGLRRPFYRFHIMESTSSNQHLMLLGLDNGESEVFYAAPRFHLIDEINAAWAANEVGTRSIFVRPREIGRLSPGPHHVAYDEALTLVCSEPKKIAALALGDVVAALQNRLAEESRPLADRLPLLLSETETAFQRGVENMAANVRTRRQRTLFTDFVARERMPISKVRAQRSLPIRAAQKLDTPQSLLRDLADKAATRFGAQLVIVQKK